MSQDISEVAEHAAQEFRGSIVPRLIVSTAAVLLLLVSSAVSAGIADSVKTETPGSTRGKNPGRVVLYYFHGNIRCQTCIQIEKWIGEIVRERFGRELQSGELPFQVLNYEKTPNVRFIKQYNLNCPAAILSQKAGGKEARWLNLEKIWEFAAEPEGFWNYIEESTREFLEGSLIKPGKAEQNKLEAQEK